MLGQSPVSTKTKHGSWSLFLGSPAVTIWEGSREQYPTSAELSKILPNDILPEQLMAIVIAVIKFAPTQVICGLLQTLSCVYRRSTKENNIDIEFLVNFNSL